MSQIRSFLEVNEALSFNCKRHRVTAWQNRKSSVERIDTFDGFQPLLLLTHTLLGENPQYGVGVNPDSDPVTHMRAYDKPDG